MQKTGLDVQVLIRHSVSSNRKVIAISFEFTVVRRNSDWGFVFDLSRSNRPTHCPSLICILATMQGNCGYLSVCSFDIPQNNCRFWRSVPPDIKQLRNIEAQMLLKCLVKRFPIPAAANDHSKHLCASAFFFSQFSTVSEQIIDVPSWFER